MYTTQVDLYEITKRFTEPARTPETLIFYFICVFHLHASWPCVVAFAGPAQALLDASWAPLSATPLPTQKARNHYLCSILALDRRPPEGTPWDPECRNATRNKTTRHRL